MLCLLILGDYQAKLLDGSYRNPMQFGTLSVSQSVVRFYNRFNSFGTTSGELDCVFLEEYGWTPMEPPSPAPPWEAQMLCWLASGELDCVFLEE